MLKITNVKRCVVNFNHARSISVRKSVVLSRKVFMILLEDIFV